MGTTYARRSRRRRRRCRHGCRRRPPPHGRIRLQVGDDVADNLSPLNAGTMIQTPEVSMATTYNAGASASLGERGCGARRCRPAVRTTARRRCAPPDPTAGRAAVLRQRWRPPAQRIGLVRRAAATVAAPVRVSSPIDTAAAVRRPANTPSLAVLRAEALPATATGRSDRRPPHRPQPSAWRPWLPASAGRVTARAAVVDEVAIRLPCIAANGTSSGAPG